jgi:hypothetical protein
MWTDEVEHRWQELAEEVLLGIKEWRLQHPKATLTEIEEAMDERWATARARILQDLALASGAADCAGAAEADRPQCPDCKTPMTARGQEVRHLVTTYDQRVTLTRSSVACSTCGRRVFPPG